MVDISHAGDYAQSVAIRAVREGNAEIVRVENREHTAVGFMETHTSMRPFTLIRVTRAFEYGPLLIDSGEIWIEGDLTLPPSPEDIEWEHSVSQHQVDMFLQVLKRPVFSADEDGDEILVTDKQYLKARLPTAFLREWIPAALAQEDPRVAIITERLEELLN